MTSWRSRSKTKDDRRKRASSSVSESSRSSRSSRRSSRSSSSSGTSSHSSSSRSQSSSSSSSRSSSASRGRRAKSQSPKNKRTEVASKVSKVHIGRLTRNVTKEHVTEIFSVYGIIKNVDLPMDRVHPHLSRGFAYIEFEKSDDAEKAIKYMDGGQIDGQEISVSLVLTPKPRPFGGQPAMRRGGPPGWARRSPRRRRTPPRYRRSPRRSRSRSRSRSPQRKRRASSSSSSR